jgi:hypothetical protein
MFYPPAQAVELRPAVSPQKRAAIRAIYINRTGRIWTESEDEKLREMAGQGAGAKAIARALDRTEGGVSYRAESLNIRFVKSTAEVRIRAYAQEARRECRLVFERPVTSLPQPVRARDIAKQCAADHGITFNDLRSTARTGPVVKARQQAMWLIARDTHLSYPQIGTLFGGRDHTTVLYAVRRENERLGENVRGAGAKWAK